MAVKIEIAHLFMTKRCNHNCPLCCNKLYDIDKIPCITNEILANIHTLCLTGGDPFYIPSLGKFISKIREQFPNIKKIYAYTSGDALYCYMADFWQPSFKLDGITVSPKNKEDWDALARVFAFWPSNLFSIESKRLVIFKEQLKNFGDFKSRIDAFENKVTGFKIYDLLGFQILGRKWEKTFHTPDNEGFYRLPILF